MTTVTLEVRSLRDVTRDVSATARSRRAGSARISFASVRLLWDVLTAKRWEILQAMAGAGPLSIREVARRVERDVKAVHADVHALINAGIVDKVPGGVVFPYDSVRVNFELHPKSA